MKILLVSNMYPTRESPSYGVFVKNISDKLESDAGISFDKSVIQGKPNNFLSKIFKYMVMYLSAFIKCIFFKYDYVYIHYISHSYLPVLFSLFFKKNKIIINIHGGDVVRHSSVSYFYFKIKSYISKLAIMHAKLIIVPSVKYKDLLTSDYQADANRIVVYASGGVDTSVFTHLKPRQKKDVLVLGYVGRLEPVKGLFTLLDAMALLKSNKVSFKLIIVGSGSLQEKLQDKIVSFGLQNEVSIIKQVVQSKLVNYYRLFDTFVFPSESESLGLVGLEAMSCGCPVIGSNIDGIRSYLKSGYNGFLFEEGDSKDLYHKIIFLNSLPSENYFKLCKNAIDTVKPYDSRVQTEILISEFIKLRN